jgi:hypothetical protein
VGAAVEVKGGPELRRALKKAGADLRDLSGLHKKVAAAFVPRVSAAAPKGETGKLSGSFRASGVRTKARAKSSLVYAPVINYGWHAHNIEPARFAERALASFQSQAAKMYEDGMKVLCKKTEATMAPTP